jgi:uncharacterized damage-inducible protein DinB
MDGNKVWINSFKRGLHGVWSHPDPFEVLDGVDFATAGKRVEGLPHTIWQISRHMIEWGWVMVNKIRGLPVKSYDKENNFFPVEDAPANKDVWSAHVMALKNLAVEASKLLDGDFDPGKTIPEFDNMTTADALMILITHNAYHAAQIVMLRRMLGAWK